MHFIFTIFFAILILVFSSFNLQATLSDEEENIFYSYSSESEEEKYEVFPKPLSPYAGRLSESVPDKFWGVTNIELEDLFAHSNDLVCIIDYGGKLIRVNKRWQEVLGYEDEELMGKSYYKFIHPKDLQKTLEYEKKYSYAGLVNRYQCRNGMYRWLDWMGFPHKARDNQFQYRFALARDITLHKIYEKEINKKAKTKVKGINKSLIVEAVAAVQAAQVGDLMSQEGGGKNSRTLEVILQNFIQLTESSFGFIGEVFYDLHHQASFCQSWSANILAKEEIKLFCADNNLNTMKGIGFDTFLEKVLKEKKPLILSNFKEIFEGQTIPTVYRSIKTFLGIPFFNQGELTGVVGLSNCHDLVGIIGVANHVKGYEESLIEWLKPLSLVAGKATGDAKQDRLRREIDNERQDRIRAEEANHMKTLFIAHMSHEIRTPLTGIIGHLDLIEQDFLSKQNLTNFQNIQISAQSLLHIANDILDIAKLEAGIFKLQEKEFKIRQSLQETIDILRTDIEAKKLNLQVNIASNVPEWVKGDDLRLRQIMFNLLNNAFKFTDIGSIQIDFQARPDFQKKNQLILSGQIKDTGIGMTENTLNKIFKPFFQEDSSLYRQFGGIGLGLHVTHQICEAMGGTIVVKSQFGHGSIFSFDITVRQLEPTPLQSQININSFPALNVLIAEDNALIQKVFKATLSKIGCQVTIAPNGLEALNAVKAGSFDVVLMDGEMPIMDGLEATRQIRQYLGSKYLPIIGVTAHALISDRSRFLASGMNGYLTKPVKLEDLKGEILRCLALNESHLN